MPRPTVYRPDIDGLRAIAVVMVALWHAFPDALPGGFVGVDVFFVISGFLITGIVIDGVDAQRFSWATFYLRRARRILPALVCVLFAVWTAGLLGLPSAAFQRLGAHVLAGATFSSNLLLWSESGYFDLGADHKPLLHLWSLAVEEQFYLLWPLGIVLTTRLGGRRAWVAALAAVSFAASVVLVYRHPTTAFYGLPTRMWELLVGAMLVEAAPVKWGARTTTLVSVAALAALGLAALALHEALAFPGLWALLPVLATAVLIATVDRSPLRHVLSWRPLVGIGRVSYPLYLWHWPLLTLPAMIRGVPLTAPERAAALGVALALAFATTHACELPIRRRVAAWETTPRRRAIAGATLVAPLLLFAMLGNLTRLAWVETPTQAIGRREDAPAMRPWIVDGQVVWDTDGKWSELLFDRGCVPGPGGKNVVFLGDSTLQATGGKPDANFVNELRTLLPPTWCVHNLAQAGFLAEQKAELARMEMQRAHVDVLVWGVWGEREEPAAMGGEHVGPDQLRVKARSAAHELPASDTWRSRSTAWDATIAQWIGPAVVTDVLPTFEATRVEAEARGTRLVLALLPELGRPFGEPPPVVDDVKRDVRAWGEAHQLPVIDLGARWAGALDVEAVRLDTCCHYNAAGHHALALLFRDVLLAPAPLP